MLYSKQTKFQKRLQTKIFEKWKEKIKEKKKRGKTARSNLIEPTKREKGKRKKKKNEHPLNSKLHFSIDKEKKKVII